MCIHQTVYTLCHLVPTYFTLAYFQGNFGSAVTTLILDISTLKQAAKLNFSYTASEKSSFRCISQPLYQVARLHYLFLYHTCNFYVFLRHYHSWKMLRQRQTPRTSYLQSIVPTKALKGYTFPVEAMVTEAQLGLEKPALHILFLCQLQPAGSWRRVMTPVAPPMHQCCWLH